MRAASVVSALLLVALAMIVAVRAGIVLREWQPASRPLVWAVVAYCSLAVVANAITPSRSERRMWLPVAILLLTSSVVVALG